MTQGKTVQICARNMINMEFVWGQVKDPVTYKFSCIGCSTRYVGGTNRCIHEHLYSDKHSKKNKTPKGF